MLSRAERDNEGVYTRVRVPSVCHAGDVYTLTGATCNV
jgi:hypothetical protein